MRSVKLCFNKGLYGKNLQRTWPLWFLYLLIWSLAMPLAVSSVLRYSRGDYVLQDIWQDIYGSCSSMGITMGCLFGMAVAIAMFTYLMQPRSIGMMHSLPISRLSLYVTNVASGLTVILGTHLITAVWTYLVVLTNGYSHPETLLAILSWLGAVSCEAVFFFALTMLCIHITGQLLAVPVFYGIFNLLVPGVETFINLMKSWMLYGFGNTLSWEVPFSPFSKWFFPLYQLSDRVSVMAHRDPTTNKILRYSLTGWNTLLIYLAAAVILLVLSFLLYRSRPSEHAADIIAISWLRPVFKYSAGFCGALVFGQALYAILFSENMDYDNYLLPMLILCMVLMGLIVYFAAEMLLKKSVKIFRGSWKGAAALSAVVVLLCIGVRMDLFGYESYVPDAQEVQSVELYLNSRDGDIHMNYVYDSDDEAVPLILALHQTIVEDKELQYRRGADQESYYAEQERSVLTVQLDYHLKNGTEHQRVYKVYVQKSDLKDANSAAAQAEALANLPSAWTALLFPGQTLPTDPKQIASAEFTYHLLWQDPESPEGICYDTGDYRQLSAAEAQRLYQYLLALKDTALRRCLFPETGKMTEEPEESNFLQMEIKYISITCQGVDDHGISFYRDLYISDPDWILTREQKENLLKTFCHVTDLRELLAQKYGTENETVF